MKILLTGSDGFIGKNLCVHLAEQGYDDIIKFDRNNTLSELDNALEQADFIYHLAGVNRPKELSDFDKGNAGLTQYIVEYLEKNGKATPVLITSSIQAELDNPYGKSKALAENALTSYHHSTLADVYIYRLPNVFGKWCRPNYNSVVATFCHNTVNGLPLTVSNPSAELNLVYIDDVCKAFINHLECGSPETVMQEVAPVYQTSVGELADILSRFNAKQGGLFTEKVGTGLVRALYSTYLSYYKPEDFSYSVARHGDERGIFVEMLKTQDSGQFSFFTAHPGITRGGHYHHSKNEKFLVIKGKASFKFRHIITDETHEIVVDSAESRIVETVPGWSHDVTNIGDDELIVMLWANEVFDPENPDTTAYKV